MILFRLFFEFFLIGLISVGGGLATIPYLADLSERTGWFTASELYDMIAVSESTPGPIGINLATYAGFKSAGVPGVFAATLGEAAPSVIVILLVAKFITKYRSLKAVDGAMTSLRPAACGLIAAVLVELVIAAVMPALNIHDFRPAALILIAAVSVPIMKTKLHPILFIAIGAAAGIIFKM